MAVLLRQSSRMCWLFFLVGGNLCCQAFLQQPHAHQRSTRLWETSTERVATFGMGCFWKPSEEMMKLDGVENVVVGYTGVDDAEKIPSYDSVCYGGKYVEGVRVVYNSEIISFPELLDAFYEAQEPRYGSRQYSSVIFAHSEEQELEAEEWLSRTIQPRADGVSPSWTTMEPATPFFQAEQYHQNYWPKTRVRVAGLLALIVISSGRLDAILPTLFEPAQVHEAANVVSLLGMFYILIERKFDKSVVRLD